MSIFDTFASDASTVVDDIKSAVSSGLSALQPGSSSPGAPGTGVTTSGSVPYYKVIIQTTLPSGQLINLVADGPQNFSFMTALTYESPYQNMGEEALDKLAGYAGPAGAFIKGAIHGSGTRMFTQALTAKVWTGANETTIQLPLILQAETDGEKDVLTPLMQLMFLSMPRESKAGGFLSSPGPVFDWTGNNSGSPANAGITFSGPQQIQGFVAGSNGSGSTPLGQALDLLKSVGGTTVDAATKLASGNISQAVTTVTNGASSALSGVSAILKNAVKYPISLQIGQGMRFDSVVIESVQQNHNLQPIGDSYNHSSGINARVQVDVTFKTFYTLTQRDIFNMLVPMGLSGSNTNTLYQAYLGSA